MSDINPILSLSIRLITLCLLSCRSFRVLWAPYFLFYWILEAKTCSLLFILEIFTLFSQLESQTIYLSLILASGFVLKIDGTFRANSLLLPYKLKDFVFYWQCYQAYCCFYFSIYNYSMSSSQNTEGLQQIDFLLKDLVLLVLLILRSSSI